MPRQPVKHGFWVCLKGCFRRGLTYESVAWVQRFPLFQYGRASSNLLRAQVEKKAEEKQLPHFPSWVKTSVFPCPQTSELPTFKPSDSRDLKSAPDPWIWMKLYHWISSLRMAHCGTSRSPNPHEPIPIRKPSSCIYIFFFLFSVCLENSNIPTPFIWTFTYRILKNKGKFKA